MRTFLGDIGYALRMFTKKPGFALTAILTLGLGIGAAAAIFSVVNAVLLRPLPYAQPDRLVHVASDMRNRNVERFPWPPADFHDLRTSATAFSGVAALATGRQVFVDPGTDRCRAGEHRRGDAEPVQGARRPAGHGIRFHATRMARPLHRSNPARRGSRRRGRHRRHRRKRS